MPWWNPKTWGRKKRAVHLGAKKGGRNMGWVEANHDPNTIIAEDAETLRSRARGLVRDNPHAAQAVELYVSNVVGEGIRPNSNTGDSDLDALVDGYWRRFATACCGDSKLDVYGSQSLAVRELFVSGDGLVRRRPRRLSDGLPVPLQIEAVQIDLLDTSKHGTLTNKSGKTTGRRIQGVEFDALGRRVGYWLFQEHPGSTVSWAGTMKESVFVPIRSLAHAYRMTEAGQVRGITRLAPVIQALKDLGDASDAERVRRRVAACLAAFVTGGDADVDDDVDGLGPQVTSGGTKAVDVDNNPITALRPGMVAHLYGDKRIEFTRPPAAEAWREFKTTELEGVAVGMGATYAALTGDYSQYSFSSSRAAILEFRRQLRPFQRQIVIPMICQPIWDWFILAAILAGKIPARFDDEGQIDYPVDWVPPMFEEVDRLKDAAADAQEIANGTISRSAVIRRRGGDPEKTFREIAAEKKLESDLAAEFGIDAEPARSADLLPLTRRLLDQ